LKHQEIANHISTWLKDYALQAKMRGFIVGISGGIDSALTSSLCALTGLDVLCLNMPIHQRKEEYDLAAAHIEDLKKRFTNVRSMEIDLTQTFETFKVAVPEEIAAHHLSMANTRSRLRMVTLYALGQANNLLVAGTGNKVEDFGIGFYTKYGDGGVDLSPIADLNKTEVSALGKYLGVIDGIVNAAPTDGLWGDGRTDEDQIGATYPELEWAMEFDGNASELSPRQQEVLKIYRRFNTINQHKMQPIPVCEIPKALKV
jgi:NAD+ synthase